MRVLIVGEGKSGTTALLRSVSAALGDPAVLFEPDDLETFDLAPDPLVAKKMLSGWKPHEAELLTSFDRRVLLLRDPRDRLVSHLLYDAYNRGPRLNQRQRDRWIRVLTRKIENPDRVPLVWVMEAWWKISKADLMNGYMLALQRSSSFGRHHGSSFHTTHYEQYVDGEFGPLSEYLGLAIAPGRVVGDEERVERSGSHGEWRRWFTRTDVSVFRPTTSRWLKRHGYDPDDWELAVDGPIPAATSTEYVASLFDAAGSA